MPLLIDWTDEGYTREALEVIQVTGDRVPTDYETDRAAFLADLRGAATMLGFAFPVGTDVAAELEVVLLVSRDSEGEKSEGLVRAGDKKAAVRHSARRGWLDSSLYYLRRGAEKLEQLRRSS